MFKNPMKMKSIIKKLLIIISIFILNQTNYDKETAIEKLKQWNNDYTNVIREYLNPNFKKKRNQKKAPIKL